MCRRWRQDRLARDLAWQVEDRDVKRRQTHTLSQNGGNPQRRLVRMVMCAVPPLSISLRLVLYAYKATSVYLSANLSVCLSLAVYLCQSVGQSASLPACQLASRSVSLSVCLSLCLSISLSPSLSVFLCCSSPFS